MYWAWSDQEETDGGQVTGRAGFPDEGCLLTLVRTGDTVLLVVHSQCETVLAVWCSLQHIF